MDFNIEIRRKQLENLDQFISSSKDRVNSILDFLGWNAQKITENQKEMIKCRYNPNHRIPASSAASHAESCAWRKESYAEDDLPLSEPNPVPGSTIVIDDITKVNVLNNALAQNPQMKTGWRGQELPPKTSNRLLSSFTPDERLALYDYSVAVTKSPPDVPEFNINKPKIEERHNLTLDEIKALERDARRRRIKYKTRSVHTKHKSATEVLREVIEGQMEQFEDWLKEPEEPADSDPEQQEGDNSMHETASQKSSRSQNSYKSQESRHKLRHRTRSKSKDRSRDRSRSQSIKKDERYRYDSRNKYRDNNSSHRRYDDRDYDRKYKDRQRSREHRSTSSHSRSRSGY